MSKKILVTGGAGYLGSVVVSFLSEHGYSCTVVDTNFFKNCSFYPEAPLPTPAFEIDIRDFDLNKVSEYDAVVHLAGISNDPLGSLNPAQVYDPTREYTKTVAAACKQFGVRFIFSSSCSVYGKATSDVVNENSEPNPQTPYSLNKLQIEQDLLAMSDTSFNPVMLRFATVYGLSPLFRVDLVVNMLAAMSVSHGKLVLNSDGKALRPHLHILDAAQSVKCALDLEKINSPILVNVGRDEDNLSIFELAQKVSALSGNCPIEFLNQTAPTEGKFSSVIADRKLQNGADTRSYRVSFAKIKKEFPNFDCKWDLNKGISQIRERLLAIGFSKTDFENERYYRLQTIESLFANKKIDSLLRWL